MRIDLNKQSVTDLSGHFNVLNGYELPPLVESGPYFAYLNDCIWYIKTGEIRGLLLPHLLLAQAPSDITMHQEHWETIIGKSLVSNRAKLDDEQLWGREMNEGFADTDLLIGLKSLYPDSQVFGVEQRLINMMRGKIAAGEVNARTRASIAYYLDLALGFSQNIVLYSESELHEMHRHINNIARGKTSFYGYFYTLLHLAVTTPDIIRAHPDLVPVLIAELTDTELVTSPEYWVIYTVLAVVTSKRSALQNDKLVFHTNTISETNVLPSDLQI